MIKNYPLQANQTLKIGLGILLLTYVSFANSSALAQTTESESYQVDVEMIEIDFAEQQVPKSETTETVTVTTQPQLSSFFQNNLLILVLIGGLFFVGITYLLYLALRSLL